MAISTIKTNLNNDLYLADGYNLAIISGEEAIVQGVAQATRMIKGENPFDQSEGVGYFDYVFCPQPSYDMLRFDLTQAALSVPVPVSVQDITMARGRSQTADLITSEVSSGNNDALSYQILIATVYGRAVIEESVYG